MMSKSQGTTSSPYRQRRKVCVRLIYDYLFILLGVQPFDFDISVLDWLNVTPSQLYVNGWTFMMEFQILY